tara:strand:+ start:450 stop:647 length:198 start_codon:yes stop_codon:yes gene_type:complete
MTDKDIELVVYILSEVTDKFWVVCEHGNKFLVIGGNPRDLKNRLDEKVNRFSWRDQFNRPRWDEY